MIVLDTNVVSALMREEPEARIVRWFDRQPSESIWTTAITVFEVQFGIARLETGRRRRTLEREFAALLEQDLEQRILPFDTPSALQSADLANRRRQAGRPVEIRDLQIGGIVLSRSATLATRNTRDFEDPMLQLIDPWTA